MGEFLKSLANIIVIAVTALGIIAVFFEKITPLTGLISLAILLLIGFITLIIVQINKLEKRIEEQEKKFISVDKLIDIKKDIEAFKLLKLIKK